MLRPILRKITLQRMRARRELGGMGKQGLVWRIVGPLTTSMGRTSYVICRVQGKREMRGPLSKKY